MKKTMEEIEPKANTTRRPKYLWLRLQKDFSLKLGGWEKKGKVGWGRDVKSSSSKDSGGSSSNRDSSSDVVTYTHTQAEKQAGHMHTFKHTEVEGIQELWLKVSETSVFVSLQNEKSGFKCTTWRNMWTPRHIFYFWIILIFLIHSHASIPLKLPQTTIMLQREQQTDWIPGRCCVTAPGNESAPCLTNTDGWWYASKTSEGKKC